MNWGGYSLDSDFVEKTDDAAKNAAGVSDGHYAEEKRCDGATILARKKKARRRAYDGLEFFFVVKNEKS